MPTHRHGFWSELGLSWRALFDTRTPFAAKALIVFGLVYGVSPLDFIPDFLPFVGQMDDIGILVMVVLAFLKMSRGVRQDLRKNDDVVETTARKAS
jgi:uncharacterized membrane protein YkvA (DUF1232 family)